MMKMWSKFYMRWLPVDQLCGVAQSAALGKYRNDDLARRIKAGTEERPIEVVFRDNYYFIISGQALATVYMNAATDDATLMCKVYEWDEDDFEKFGAFTRDRRNTGL